MKYNNIGKFVEETLGATEFWVYSTKDLETFFNKEGPLQGRRIVKVSADAWRFVK